MLYTKGMPYNYDPKRVVYFAATDSRNKKIPFGIRAEDRMRHMYIIGKTGMGKSTLLENMAIQDIQNGEGLAFIDPHGSTAEKLLDFVPENRINDVLYMAPFDTNFPIGFNIMEDVGYDKRHLVVAGLMSSFQRIWVDAWSARMEYILQNTLLALLEYPGTTLIDVNHMLVNKDFRRRVTEYVTDPIVKRFWAEEFAGYTDRYTQDATPAIQNKIGQFTSNPLVRNIIGQSKSSFDIRKMMDEGKILIINLSKGRMGEQNADLLGSIITTKMYLSAMSRAEETPDALAKLPPFYLYVDEFQSVVNDSFANILSEARKYKLSLTIAHQYIEQVEENIQHAVFGNVGTTITFRVGPFDAEVLKTIFEPTFYAEDLVNLSFAQIYLTLMIDGVGSQPFSATTLPPVEEASFSFREQIIEHSRSKYARPRAEIEDFIRNHDKNVQVVKPTQTQAPAQQAQQTQNKKKKKRQSDGSSIGGGQRREENTVKRRENTPAPSSAQSVAPSRSGTPQKGSTQQKSEQQKPPQERNELRDALAALVKNTEAIQKKLDSQTTATQQPKYEQRGPAPGESAKNETKDAHTKMPSAPQEIPEDTLKALLDIRP
jgi:hypothetical protein